MQTARRLTLFLLVFLDAQLIHTITSQQYQANDEFAAQAETVNDTITITSITIEPEEGASTSVAANGGGCLSQALQNLRNFDWILMPDSTLIRIWEWLLLVVAMVVAVVYLYAASFIGMFTVRDSLHWLQ